MSQLSARLLGSFPQELTIRVRGPDVRRLASLAGADEEAPLPDLGPLFAEAARAGLFGGVAVPPWEAVAEQVRVEMEPELQRACWSLRLGGVDPGMFRVLWNVLRARELEEADLSTTWPAGSAGVAPLELGRLAYPGVYGKLPFQLEVEAPLRSSKDRSVQVVFEQPPPEEVVDRVLAALERWDQLLLLGGYPEDGVEPARSGAFPEPPFQLDEVTVEQAFPELFAADEAAFHAIANHAAAVHHAGVAVAAVVVR